MKFIPKLKDKELLEKIKKKINYISVLNLFKVIFEASIPMVLLLLAFQKLAIISLFYVFFVCLVIFVSWFNKVSILNTVLIIGIWIQYLLILTNITNELSPTPFDNPPSNIPIP